MKPSPLPDSRASAAKAPDADRLIKLVRLCFQRLRAAGDTLHADLGISASLRAALETLYELGEDTVPEIARAKSVSRQHIQKIVDALLPLGHVTARANPGHRRSPLIALTAKGRRLFETMRQREAGVVAALAKRLDGAELAAALRTLAILAESLPPRSKGESDDE
ncbi:MAG TPA: MarR family winged helix-turn-helix transcriptional regulator [Alphaproteobacteria bacterium]|jgi:DNA-binding MarR family transcriptional regulator